MIGWTELPDWWELSSSELRARLEQRGISASTAALLDAHREHFAKEISEYLDAK